MPALKVAWRELPPDFDLLWVGWCSGVKVPNGPRYSAHLARHNASGCTHAYIVSPLGAARLLSVRTADARTLREGPGQAFLEWLEEGES